MTAIAAGDAVMQRAIDYVVGFLVNDVVDMLKKVIQALEQPEQLVMLSKLDVCAAHLKYGFDSRLKDLNESHCVLHDIIFGLLASTDHPRFGSLCGNVFAFYDYLHARLASVKSADTSMEVVCGCKAKAQLYLGHRLRVVIQQKQIAAVVQAMRERCTNKGVSDEALLVIDHNMELEPLH